MEIKKGVIQQLKEVDYKGHFIVAVLNFLNTLRYSLKGESVAVITYADYNQNKVK